MAYPEGERSIEEKDLFRRIDRTIARWGPGETEVGRMLAQEIRFQDGTPLEPVKGPDRKTILAFTLPSGDEEALRVVIERDKVTVGDLSFSTSGLAELARSNQPGFIKAVGDAFTATVTAAREVRRAVSPPSSGPVRRTLPSHK